MDQNILLEQNLIELSTFKIPAQILAELNDIIENNDLSDKKLKINLGNTSLTQANLYGIKAILENADAKIELIYTTSIQTQLAALGAGLAVSEKVPEINENNIDLNEEDSSSEYNPEQALENALEEEIESKNVINASHNIEGETLYLKQTLRSGQTINFDGNVVIIGDCNPGSEIVAGGDITVWGILGGIAHAGSKGDASSSIRAFRINAIQLRIANLIARKPDRLLVEKAEKTNTFKPEEAKISNGEIIINSLNN